MEATYTSQVFSRCQVHYWTPHILFSCDPYKSPQSSYYCLQFTEKIDLGIIPQVGTSEKEIENMGG